MPRAPLPQKPFGCCFHLDQRLDDLYGHESRRGRDRIGVGDGFNRPGPDGLQLVGSLERLSGRHPVPLFGWEAASREAAVGTHSDA